MAGGTFARVEGAEALIAELGKKFDTEKMQKNLGKACAIVEGAAKKKAPKGDGTLRSSITYKVNGTVGIVYTPLEYAPYVEFGTGIHAESGGRQDVPWSYKDEQGEWHTTSGMKPQPYLRPALHESREMVLQVLKEGLVE